MKTTFLLTILFTITLCTKSQDSAGVADNFQKGLREKNAKRYKPAFEYFQTAAAENPSNIDAHRELGLAAVEIRQAEIARQAFKKVIEAVPSDTIALDQLTTLSFATRKWDDAIQYGLKMLASNRGRLINYIVGKSYYEKENFGLAFRYLDAAYKEEPTRAEIPFLFARAFVEMSNYKFAVRYYLEAVALDSTKTNWVVELAMAYSSIPDEKKAIEYYELALERGHKADAVFMENLSNSYIAGGMPDKGINVLVKLLEARPADLDLLYNVADTYYRLGKYQLAIDHWDTILKYDKENSRSLYMIGMAYQKKGDISKGTALCDRAIAMDPSLKSHRTEVKF